MNITSHRRIKTIAPPFLVLTLALVQPCFAATFYADPVKGSMSNDGSQQRPWRSLKEIFSANLIESQEYAPQPYTEGKSVLKPKNAGAPVKAGDTIVLLSGDHGAVDVTGYSNADTITIEAAPDAKPVLQNFSMKSGMNWTLRGLTVSPEPFGKITKTRLVEFIDDKKTGPGSKNIVENCEVYSLDDASKWKAADWDKLACSGIRVEGEGGFVRNNLVRNVRFGISCGSYVVVEHNKVINFSGDGLRGLSDFSTFQYNLVKNCYNVNKNHDDGFQSWSSTKGKGVGQGTVRGVVLRGNTIIQDDGSVPEEFRGPLQGIGCFDGFFEDWVIENNLIVAEAKHGLALYGAINCRIVNNTVLDRVVVEEKTGPWIHVTNHKSRGPGRGNTIINNVSTGLAFASNEGGTESNNLKVANKDFDTWFVDAEGWNYRPAPGSPLIGAGTSDGAPTTDITGEPRTQGKAVDVGAFNFLP